jgi:hypothetical protein
MDKEIDFKALWQTNTFEAPSINEIEQSVAAVRQKLYKRILMLSAIVVLTSIFMVKIMIATESKMLSTQIGIGLSIVAMCVFALSNYTLLPNMKKTNESNNVLAQLKALKEIQQKQKYIQSTMLNFYFVTLGIGIGLAVWESLHKQLIHIFLGYAFIVVWILINWFVLRPKIAKKQQAQVDDVVQQLTKIQSQLVDA